MAMTAGTLLPVVMAMTGGTLLPVVMAMTSGTLLPVGPPMGVRLAPDKQTLILG